MLSLVILLFIGFFTFGPHILLVAALPADLGTCKAASSVTGFIDTIGYLGANLTGVGTGYLVEKFGWDAGFYFWICGAIFAAIMILFLWNYKSIKRVNMNKITIYIFNFKTISGRII